MNAITRLGKSGVFATFVNSHTLWLGFFYYFPFFLEQCLICITAYLGIISRVKVTQMSNATTRNMEKMNPLKVLSPGILLHSVAEGLGVEEARTVFVSYIIRASMEERMISQLQRSRC